MNNKSLKRVLSFFMSALLCFSSFSLNVFANTLESNKVFLQKNGETEVIDLPSNLTLDETLKLKQNITLYGNTNLTEQQIMGINQKAKLRGGLVNGPWFGGYSEYYSMSLDESMVFTSALLAVVTPFLSASGVISLTSTKVVNGFAAFLGVRYSLPGWVEAGEWVKADMRKQYREVKYTDGTLAYFETGFFANNLNVANKSYGTAEAIFSGGLY